LAALERAETLAEGAPRSALLRLWATEGAVRYRLDRPAEAAVWIERALGLAEELGSQEIAANCMLNLSLVCDELGSPDESLRWAERAVERSQLIGADRQLAFSLLHLTALLIDALRLDEAEAALARLSEPVERMDSDEARYSARAREAEFALARGQFGRALEAATRGHDLAQEHPRNQANFHILRTQALLGLSRPGEALAEARLGRAELSTVGASADAEEAMAYAAQALRALGREGPERDELRALQVVCTFSAALEKALGAQGDAARRLWSAEARRLAIHPRWKAELEAMGL
jgi:tetratricopeptide (TPR) repeat protein